MPASCSAPRCTNTSSDGYCLVCVPIDDDLRNVWINAAKNPEWTPSKHARLCEVNVVKELIGSDILLRLSKLFYLLLFLYFPPAGPF